MEILTHVLTHVDGWEPAVYMTHMSQNFRLFLVSNLSVLNFRFFSAHVSVDTHRTASEGGGVPPTLSHCTVTPLVYSHQLPYRNFPSV